MKECARGSVGLSGGAIVVSGFVAAVCRCPCALLSSGDARRDIPENRQVLLYVGRSVLRIALILVVSLVISHASSFGAFTAMGLLAVGGMISDAVDQAALGKKVGANDSREVPTTA